MLVKQLADALWNPLSLIYSSLMSAGNLPSVLKRATAIPVFKAGAILSSWTTDPFHLPACLQVNGACDYPSNIFVFVTARTYFFSSTRIYYKAIYNHQLNRNTNTLDTSNQKSSFSHRRYRKLLLQLDRDGIRGNLLNLIKNFYKTYTSASWLVKYALNTLRWSVELCREAVSGPFSPCLYQRRYANTKRKHPWKIVCRQFKVIHNSKDSLWSS